MSIYQLMPKSCFGETLHYPFDCFFCNWISDGKNLILEKIYEKLRTFSMRGGGYSHDKICQCDVGDVGDANVGVAGHWK